jgi:choline-glycine betaine transporter
MRMFTAFALLLAAGLGLGLMFYLRYLLTD